MQSVIGYKLCYRSNVIGCKLCNRSNVIGYKLCYRSNVIVCTPSLDTNFATGLTPKFVSDDVRSVTKFAFDDVRPVAKFVSNDGVHTMTLDL
jgi:hypothetical protein